MELKRAQTTTLPSLVHDGKSDVPRGESVSTRAPHSADNFLRIFGDPRDGPYGQEFFLEDVLEFLQPTFVADVVANAVYTKVI